MALYNGKPLRASQTIVVSLWLAMPMVNTSSLFIVCNTVLIHCLTAPNISWGSCSTHPSLGFLV